MNSKTNYIVMIELTVPLVAQEAYGSKNALRTWQSAISYLEIKYMCLVISNGH